MPRAKAPAPAAAAKAPAPAAATASVASPPKEEAAVTSTAPASVASLARSSKLDRLVALLTRPEGATLVQMMDATGWQAHSVRGALAGSLRKKGHAVTSEKVDGTLRYRIGVEGIVASPTDEDGSSETGKDHGLDKTNASEPITSGHDTVAEGASARAGAGQESFP